MSIEGQAVRSPTSAAHDVYEVLFQATDMVSAVWLPAAKSIGRWQLELAQLTAKQVRANMELGQKLVHMKSPENFAQAYHEYWSDVTGFYGDASRNIATALVRAAPHTAVLQLPLTKVPEHDTLRLIDTPEQDYQRKVA